MKKIDFVNFWSLMAQHLLANHGISINQYGENTHALFKSFAMALIDSLNESIEKQTSDDVADRIAAGQEA